MKLKLVNFNKIYDLSKVIRNPEAVVAKTKTFSKDGIFSEEVFGNLNEAHSYSCQCGKLKGKFYLGFICQDCGGTVKFTESAVGRIGWVDLSKKYKIVSPLFYGLMSRVTTKRVLDEIVSYNKKLDVHGNLVDSEEAGQTDRAKHPYANVGLIRFRRVWLEALRFYAKDNPTKKRIVAFLERNQGKVWAGKFPIIPTILRPAVMIRDAMVFDEVNNLYNSLIAISNLIAKATEVERRSDLDIPPMLASLQATANKIFDKVLDSVRGKHGYLRSSIMGKLVDAHIKLS